MKNTTKKRNKKYKKDTIINTNVYISHYIIVSELIKKNNLVRVYAPVPDYPCLNNEQIRTFFVLL